MVSMGPKFGARSMLLARVPRQILQHAESQQGLAPKELKPSLMGMAVHPPAWDKR